MREMWIKLGHSLSEIIQTVLKTELDLRTRCCWVEKSDFCCYM